MATAPKQKPRPSIVRQTSRALLRRASKSFHEQSGIHDLHEAIGSIDNKELYKLRGEYNLHFDNHAIENEFIVQWRELGILQGFVAIIVVFMLWKGFSINEGVLTTAENWGTTGPVLVLGIAIILIIQFAPNFIKRNYDLIVVSYMSLECIVVMLQLLLMSRGTLAYESETNFACLAPVCEAVGGNPSVVVMGLLFISTTSLRLRFAPAAILSFIVVLTEEITLNIDGNPDALDIINQVIALILVAYEGLLAAHQLEVTHRTLFVLQRNDHKSNEEIENQLHKGIHNCCPSMKGPKTHCCLRFKKSTDHEKFLTYQYAKKFEEGVGLWGLCTATFMSVFFYLLALPTTGGPEAKVDTGLREFGLPENTDYDWRLNYAMTFIALYILLPILLVGAAYEYYIQKRKLEFYKAKSATSRRVGFALFAILPLLFGCLWSHAVSDNYGNALFHLYKDSPEENAKCLSQSVWGEIVNADLEENTTLVKTVCEMTKTYNTTRGFEKPCDSKEFESITSYCTYYGMFAYTVFVFQTQALWIVPDMVSGSIIIVLTGLYGIMASFFIIGPHTITLESIRILNLVAGALLCLYEQTITAQRQYVLTRHTEKRKSLAMVNFNVGALDLEKDDDGEYSTEKPSIQASYAQSKDKGKVQDGEKAKRKSNFELPNMKRKNSQTKAAETV